MSDVEIKKLYHNRRLPENGLEFCCLLLYLPVGIILVAWRTFIGLLILLLGCILPSTEIVNNCIHKLICFSLGISINIENLDKKEKVDVYVSNHLSDFDQLAVHAVTGALTPGIKINPVLSGGFGIRYCGNMANFDSFKKNISVLLSEHKVPLHFNPESKITNGKSILKFKTYPFSFTTRIQPICIEITRPYFDVTVTTLGSGFWSNVLFYLFLPCTNYKLQFLPPLDKNNMSDEEFAEAARQSIATALKIKASDYSASDLLEWEKRLNTEQQRVIQRSPITVFNSTPELHRMTLQVREVLPYVPYNAVHKDLTKTRSVDVTITNILEGQVHYIPETTETPSSPLRTSTQSSSANVNIVNAPSTSSNSFKNSSEQQFSTAAMSFGKSVQERSQSFQDRKQQLIENARKRYIEKHGLNLITNNC